MIYRTANTVISNVTSNFTLNNLPISHTDESESTISSSITPSNQTLNVDDDLTYNVTANIFSSSVESYSGSTSVGPLQFDCYDVVTSANNANFTNQLTLTQSDGSALPGWMTFDPSTAMITVSNTSDIAATTYILTNTYTGLLSNISYAANVSITFTEEVVNNTNTNNTNANNTNNENKDDDDYCLSASSKATCGIFIGLIILGASGIFVITGIVIYKIIKAKRNSNSDMTKIDQVDNENNDQVDQQNDNQNPETLGIHKTEEAKENQI